MEPNSASAHRILSLIYLKENNPDRAAEMAWKAIRLNRQLAPTYYILAEIFRLREDLENSERNYRKYLSMRPGDLNAMLSLIEVYDVSGKTSLRDQQIEIFLSAVPPPDHENLEEVLLNYHKYANFSSILRVHRIVASIAEALSSTLKIIQLKIEPSIRLLSDGNSSRQTKSDRFPPPALLED